MMRLRRYGWFRRLATTLMVLAALAFTHQGAAACVAQAAAATGLMIEPAVQVNGPVHYHGDLARHFHAHGNHAQDGHVHDATDADQDEPEKHASPVVCSLGVCCAVIPIPAACGLVLSTPVSVALASAGAFSGIEPDTLQRPPSTPGIA
jgi:hypothetical protein